ncbi:transcription initiation factor IIA subunit 1-like [Schistocerca americana]|uniref:transcription initiation factor IIA subunit 1-like n=1 Tax=Schistocerca americana TaxID=7009 RepID=UPI001F4FBACC|nr:transcription initiation factor IIA subunit 1-like [Schistocerca americana]XP_046980227.1 transcription initiation factor IIA subunit 1-like [Schistocerca americana]XP_046980228.1 transcription initiation factor IIA subunit 1-like [Schistocerca americana]XP_046980229.1 transcription initiation factor IIA subunit 1-like [Schistocerca americana]XP_046980230.1 transcription initiation factor IIA subunit 1-like [Schistocerca americana]XP_049941288.1 transcription initiation factor IIA subunit 1
MAHSQMNVVKFYQSVIDDVISGVRENFLDEGMDEQVLQELKQLWETKVLSSKAVEVGPDNSEPQPPQLLMTKGNGVSLGMVAKTVAMPGQTQILTPVTTSMHNANNSQLHLQQHHQTQQLQQQQQQQSHQQPHQQQTLQQQLVHQQTQQASAPPQPTQQTVIVADPNKTVPVQITLPAPAGTVTIHVPVSALQGNTLQTSLTGPVITAAMALPPQVATTLLQQHVLAALQAAQQQQQQQQSQQQQQAAIQQIPRQTDGQDDSDTPGGSGHSQRTTEVILQLDGHNDTSDEEDEDVDDDGDDDDEDETEDRVDDDENEDEANGGGQEEEPLNSGDDVSEDDPTDLFDTDNVIVCQYDKITRSRNKWKFYLKDGIMNLNGKDFVFQKSNGDAEW